MSEAGWTSVVSHREQKRNRDDQLHEERLRAEEPRRAHHTRDLAWFEAAHSPRTGTEDEYDRNHARLYGAEEGLVNGKHRKGQSVFPTGSARDIGHRNYSESTEHRDRARKSYDDAHRRHLADNKRWTKEESIYYSYSTDKLLATQHADLSSRALDLADAARRNGSLRTDFEDMSPFTHHSLPQAIKHHYYAKGAFEEHEIAIVNYNYHQIYRSSAVDDGQRDCYGRRVTAGTRPHTRSRNYELPPPGYYSAFPTTPPREPEEEEEEEEESSAVPAGLTTPHDGNTVGRRHSSGTPNSRRPRKPDRW